MAEKEHPDFEEALTKLEDIIERLDSESISLEKSMELYEKGISLAKQCTDTLEKAELRIEKVNEQHTEK